MSLKYRSIVFRITFWWIRALIPFCLRKPSKYHENRCLAIPPTPNYQQTTTNNQLPEDLTRPGPTAWRISWKLSYMTRRDESNLVLASVSRPRRSKNSTPKSRNWILKNWHEIWTMRNVGIRVSRSKNRFASLKMTPRGRKSVLTTSILMFGGRESSFRHQKLSKYT